MNGAYIALLLVAVATTTCMATTIICDKSQNYGGAQGAIYNTACPGDRPYCTGSGLCSECALGKDPLCDCPSNYKCAAARFNTVRDADFCAPMPLTVIDGVCVDANDCAIELTSKQTATEEIAFYTSCVNSECRYCNGRSYSSVIRCQRGEVPGGGDPRVYGSKTSSRGCTQVTNAWNSNTETVTPALPTDMFEYERNQYPSVQPSSGPNGSPSPASPSSSPAPATPTASLSIGASPSTTPEPSSTSSITCSIYLLVAALLVAAH